MKFKVGDKVQIKSWEEMEKEFGINCFGNIPYKETFVTDMMKYCGKVCTIEKIEGDRVWFDKKFENWSFSTDMIKPYKNDHKTRYELRFISDGETTTATYFEDGKEKLSAEAKLHPEDKFDFATGVKTCILKESKGKETFPILWGVCGNYGKVGEPTPYKDKFGRPLFIGDVVTVKSNLTDKNYTEFIVKNDGKPFIMGLECCCNEKTGRISGYEITLENPFHCIKNPTKIDDIKYCFSEKDKEK